MNRNRPNQQPPQQQFRFNKVNTAPQKDNDLKRKLDNNVVNSPSNGDGLIKKLKQEENENIQNENSVQNDQSKRHLQILNDLTIYHKFKVKYDVISESGPQHAKLFQVKCTIYDPKTESDFETYMANGSSINKAKQSAAEMALAQTKLEKPTNEQMKKRRAEFFQERSEQNSDFNNQNSSDSDGYRSIQSFTPPQNFQPPPVSKPQPLMSLMSINLDESKVQSFQNKPQRNGFNKNGGKFDKNKNNKKFGDSGKKEIKPNSAAAAALAIASQSNKSLVQSNGPQPVPQPPTVVNPAPVPPPMTSKPPVPPPLGVPPVPPPTMPGYPGYPTYPGYDPYTMQAYYAQWQAQYYQQWQWAAMNQAYQTPQTEPSGSIPPPPPPPPPK